MKLSEYNERNSTIRWSTKLIKINLWCGDKNRKCAYRELGLLRTGGMQSIKWTAEGMVKRVFTPSIPWRKARVSCREYVGILLRVWFHKTRWHRGVYSDIYTVLDNGTLLYCCQGRFFYFTDTRIINKKKGGNAKHNPTTAMIIIIALMIKTVSFIT